MNAAWDDLIKVDGQRHVYYELKEARAEESCTEFWRVSHPKGVMFFGGVCSCDVTMLRFIEPGAENQQCPLHRELPETTVSEGSLSRLYPWRNTKSSSRTYPRSRIQTDPRASKKPSLANLFQQSAELAIDLIWLQWISVWMEFPNGFCSASRQTRSLVWSELWFSSGRSFVKKLLITRSNPGRTVFLWWWRDVAIILSIVWAEKFLTMRRSRK